MDGNFGRIVLALATGVSLAACNRESQPTLMNLSNTAPGPDEFSIVPNRPLQSPSNFSELPTPTPGGSNLADPSPRDDAIRELGGDPGDPPGASAVDGGLVAYASRYGVAEGIRDRLAAEDLEFRRSNDGRVLERAFNVNTYFRAYESQSLDQRAELERFRALGAKTPSAPPEEG